jgi:hypothetical protein
MTTVPMAHDRAPEADAAAQVKDEALSKASDLKDSAAEHAGAVVDQAKTQARNVLGDAQTELRRRADEQTQRAGKALRDASQQLNGMADGAPSGPVADVTRQLASGLDRVSSRIDTGGLQAVTDDVRDFARRRPGAFLLGAGVAGFFLTRLVRAASSPTGSQSTVGSARPSLPGVPTPPFSSSSVSPPPTGPRASTTDAAPPPGSETASSQAGATGAAGTNPTVS